MKYPIGTRCWIVRTARDYSKARGRETSIVSHGDDGHVCNFCGSAAHMAEIDLPDPHGKSRRVFGCCLCVLVPIADPDYMVALDGEESLPIDPRKIESIEECESVKVARIFGV